MYTTFLLNRRNPFNLVSKGEDKTGYSPSIASDRPTTAPNRRSVRFADQLGIDLDGSITDKRPITAPEVKQYTGERKKRIRIGF